MAPPCDATGASVDSCREHACVLSTTGLCFSSYTCYIFMVEALEKLRNAAPEQPIRDRACMRAAPGAEVMKCGQTGHQEDILLCISSDKELVCEEDSDVCGV